MQQQGVKCNFADSIPWVILSPIEQSIRRKIESIGTPLKDWDINIYRGVLTGYNDAFIISTEKRDEILANCQTEGERVRTAELIRPNTWPPTLHSIPLISNSCLCFVSFRKWFFIFQHMVIYSRILFFKRFFCLFRSTSYRFIKLVWEMPRDIY